MKKFKIILLVLFGLWFAYLSYLYITSPRVTYLVRKGYEGPLLIIANQENGIDINRNHTIYDFTENNVIKIKGDLLTGFFPWGYLNYYSVDESGKKEKLETIDDAPEKSGAVDGKFYVWNYYYTTGGCEVMENGKTYYESVIISRKSNTSKVIQKKNQLINDEVCNKKATH